MDPHFPDVLKTYPPQAQVTWLYYRDHPGSPGSGRLLSQARGGGEKRYLGYIHLLREAGLLIRTGATSPQGRGRPVPSYRACTPEEARRAQPYALEDTGAPAAN